MEVAALTLQAVTVASDVGSIGGIAIDTVLLHNEQAGTSVTLLSGLYFIAEY